MPKVLILGGTGAMGKHLVNILFNHGVDCFITTRSNRESCIRKNYIKGNAHDMKFLQPLLQKEKWDAIVDFMIYTTNDFEERYNLLLDSTTQYVYISSARVYAQNDGLITEDSPRILDVCKDQDYLATDEYALTKARQENILKKSDKKNWTIIRPYITFSEIRLQLSPQEKELWLYRCLHGRSIVFSKDLAEKYTTLTYGYDVAKGIASIIGKEKAIGEIFHITVNESHKWSEILSLYVKVIKRETGIEPKVKLINKWEKHIGGSYRQIFYDRLYDRCFDNSKIAQFIDPKSFKPTLQALDECLTDFIHKQNFKEINWWSEAYKDKITGEWTSLNEIPTIKQKIKYMIIRLGLWS